MVHNNTSHKKSVTVSPPVGSSEYEKSCSGGKRFARFGKGGREGPAKVFVGFPH